MSRRALLLWTLLAAVAGGCQDAPTAAPASAPGIRLSAELTSPTDVVLRWSGADPGAAGLVVEFATDPNGSYAQLQFVPPRQATYTHPDLMPETTFHYRVRPYHGPASSTVDVTLPPGEYDESEHEDDPDWAAPRTLPDRTVTTGSIRDPKTADASAPTDLRAEIVNPNGVRFTWRDTASDEDGYLVESKAAGGAEFSPVALLDPNVNSFGLVTLPNEKQASYRVRAFYYGPSSNVVQKTTGKDNPAAR